jgi:hypothetical protein
MGSAYRDEKARRVVAVYINMETGPQMVQLDFGLGGRRWRLKSIAPHVTSDREGDELKEYPALVAGKAVEIPGRSVVTLAAQFT